MFTVPRNIPNAAETSCALSRQLHYVELDGQETKDASFLCQSDSWWEEGWDGTGMCMSTGTEQDEVVKAVVGWAQRLQIRSRRHR